MIRRGMVVAGAVAVVALVVIYVVPREMDWNRYRGQITALAAQRLGRPVKIDGDVELTILPQTVLTAKRISVTDPVTGAVFTAREMQLRVGLLALLGGTIDPQALDLEGAVLRLPWPVAPAGFKMRPPQSFAATIENGTLVVGNTTISGIDGELATYGDDGAVTVFGTAQVGGEEWGFDGSLGAIGEDHESIVSAIFTGNNATEGAMLRVNGELRDDGGFVGDLAASGPDLSQVVEAPAVSFGAEAKIQGAENVLTGTNLTLELGNAGARGSFRWQAGAPELALRVATTRLDLDQWGGVWSRPAAGGFSSRVDVTADAAQLAGGTLRNVHLDLERGSNLVVHDFTATLPGEAAFRGHGIASFMGSVVHVDSGGFTLKAGDIAPSLAWLEASDPDLPRLAGTAPLVANLAGIVSGTADAINVDGIKGTLGGVAVRGSLGLMRGDRTRVNADLSVDQLPLGAFTSLNLSPKLDYDLVIAAGSAGFAGISAQNLDFHLVRDQNGLRVENAKAEVDGAVVTGSLSSAPDGTVSDATIAATETKLAPLLALLPKDGWQGTPALAAISGSLKADFKGPLKALAGNVTVDVGETEVVARPVIDVPDQQLRGAVTVRNPGAWRLVQLLGGPDVTRWVGVGSLGLLAEVDAKAGHLGVDYLDMAFGGMRVAGGLSFDESGDKWALNGNLTSERLPIVWPALAADVQVPTGWVGGGSGKISLAASSLTLNDAPVANDFHADLALQDGVFTLGNVGMNWGAGGNIGGSATWRALDPEPSVKIVGKFDHIPVSGPITGGALDLAQGTLAGNVALSATGHTPATLLATLGGDVDLSLSDGEINGFDLVKADAAAKMFGVWKPQRALLAALKGGSSAFDQLIVATTIKDGGLSIDNGALLTDDPGGHSQIEDAELAGVADLPNGVENLAMTLHLPGGAPPVVARYKGKFAAPEASVDLAAFKKWLVQRRPKKATH